MENVWFVIVGWVIVLLIKKIKMNKNKFRIWNNKEKKFETFDQKFISKSVHQFIGILDKNMREIYERDVVKFFTYTGEELGEVVYSTDSCAYYINDYPIMNLDLASLEIVGNMVEDYMWDESGEKLVKIHEDTNS
jgi:hypothetical protein